jgi:LemA protein
MTTLIVLLVIILAVIGFGVGIYNKLIAGRNRYQNAFAQIDVQLTRRHDLIPNLVETAKGYMKHEKQTLEAVTDARNRAVSGLQQALKDPSNPDAMQQLGAAEQGLSGALGRLFALAEAYPELKANENMMQLSEALTSTENKVAFARQAYNDAVMQYNIDRESFPSNLIAGWFRFQAATLLEIEDEAKREVPQVSFT